MSSEGNTIKIFKPTFFDSEFEDDSNFNGNEEVEKEFRKFVEDNDNLKKVDFMVVRTGYTDILAEKVKTNEEKEVYGKKEIVGIYGKGSVELYSTSSPYVGKNGEVVFARSDGKQYDSVDLMNKFYTLSCYMYCEDCRPFFIRNVRWVNVGGKITLFCDVRCSKMY